MGHVQLCPGQVGATCGQRSDEMLAAVLRIREIVARMNHIKRVECADGSDLLPEMLDLLRSSTDGA